MSEPHDTEQMHRAAEERRAKAAALKARIEREDFEAELAQRIAQQRASWPTEAPIALSHSYVFVSNQVLHEAWMHELVEIVRSAPSEVSVFRGFPPRWTNGEYVFPYPDAVTKHLHRHIAASLAEGTLIASGFKSGGELDGSVEIAKDRWQFLIPDFEGNQVLCDGKVVLRGVTVSRQPAIVNDLGKLRPGTKPMFDWPKHESDFRKRVAELGNPDLQNEKGWQSQADVARFLQDLALDRDGLELGWSQAKSKAKEFMTRLRTAADN